MPAANIWGDEWQLSKRDETDASRKTRLPRGDKIGATVYELDPGSTGSAYHFHHGAEELLVVLRGRPTLRTPDGERELEEGEVVHFRVGPEGAHQVINRTEDPLRYLVVSNRPSPEAVEYPDTREVSLMALTESQYGERLWDIRTLRVPAGDTP
jgi:uncharacterized cupin superfamily protein